MRKPDPELEEILSFRPTKAFMTRPIDWTIARDLAGVLSLNLAAIFIGGYLLWEMIR